MTDKLRELVAKHPLPWSADILMIRDANRRQVLHLGGSRDEVGRGMDPDSLVELNKLTVTAANAALAASQPEPTENSGQEATSSLPMEYTQKYGVASSVASAPSGQPVTSACRDTLYNGILAALISSLIKQKCPDSVSAYDVMDEIIQYLDVALPPSDLQSKLEDTAPSQHDGPCYEAGVLEGLEFAAKFVDRFKETELNLAPVAEEIRKLKCHVFSQENVACGCDLDVNYLCPKHAKERAEYRNKSTVSLQSKLESLRDWMGGLMKGKPWSAGSHLDEAHKRLTAILEGR